MFTDSHFGYSSTFTFLRGIWYQYLDRNTTSQIPKARSSGRFKMATQYPEGRVLIVMTGGTICMKESPGGLVPARGFLDAGMASRPSFNDGSNPGENWWRLVFGCFLQVLINKQRLAVVVVFTSTALFLMSVPTALVELFYLVTKSFMISQA